MGIFSVMTYVQSEKLISVIRMRKLQFDRYYNQSKCLEKGDQSNENRYESNGHPSL